ncbi:MAG: type II toxin-antitoxin system mRNA interferase toxin, RelE/StbE family [Desulfobacterales bacterium]|nr:type II toxin-antitoxin system mRNA interferase toxin, RelE/StbE family [Desulfobacterales bacterium]
MWEIYEHKSLVRKLPKIPVDVLKRYEKWKDIVCISGPEGLRLIKGFHDESLTGKWKGYRSSRLGLQYRLIYKIEKQILYVTVIDINPHDYRKK